VAHKCPVPLRARLFLGGSERARYRSQGVGSVVVFASEDRPEDYTGRGASCREHLDLDQ